MHAQGLIRKGHLPLPPPLKVSCILDCQLLPNFDYVGSLRERGYWMAGTGYLTVGSR